MTHPKCLHEDMQHIPLKKSGIMNFCTQCTTIVNANELIDAPFIIQVGKRRFAEVTFVGVNNNE